MTDDTVTAKLAEWETLTEAATEGPWGYWGQGWVAPVNDPQRDPVGVPQNTIPRGDADAAFIAAARTAMPALIAAVKDALGPHRPHPVPQKMIYGTITACSECGSVDDAPVEWPCPTVQAVQKWIGGTGD